MSKTTIFKVSQYLLILLLISSNSSFAQQKIKWRVEAPFAPFGWLSEPGKITEDWSPREGENYLQWLKRVNQSNEKISPYYEFANKTKENPWISSMGVHRSNYANPQRVTIIAKLDGSSGKCRWEVQGYPEINPEEASCTSEVKIEDFPVSGANLVVNIGGENKPISSLVKVDHRTIVALGDSYASGEGNPDIPTLWKSKSLKKGSSRWLKDEQAVGAKWFDTHCHRSFFSNQTFVALKVASESPHRLVTFLHYACSGAEVLDGMIVRQKTPPGLNEKCNEIHNNQNNLSFFAKGEGCLLPKSQLASVVTDLCDGDALSVGNGGGRWDSLVRNVVHRRGHNLYRAKVFEGHGLDLRYCDGTLRVPDLILLSIGGNDAGFASVVGWAIAPQKYRSKIGGSLVKGQVVCPEKALSDGCKKPYDISLINQLARRYGFLGEIMDGLLRSGETTVVQTTYPNPVIKKDFTYCGDQDGSNPDNPWASAKLVLGGALKGWHFNILPGESRVLSESTILNLHKEVVAGAEINKFKVSDVYAQFMDHGWCDPDQEDPPLSLPSHSSILDQMKWACAPAEVSNNPSCWDGYKEMNRFVRTMNDSYLTQSSARKDGITGTMHPNLWGHAAIAEKLHNTVYENTPWL